MARRRRQKNLSTGAWVAIAIGLGVVVPTAIAAGLFVFVFKKGEKMIEDAEDRYDEDRERMDELPVPTRPDWF